MTRCCHLLAFGLVFALAQAAAPCRNPSPVGAPQDQNRTAPPASPPSGSQPAASAGSHTGVDQSIEIPSRPGAISGATDSELQTQIQNALRKEPTLRGDNVTVSVSANAVELSGNVASGQERQTAMRIVRSYAGSKWLVTHIEVPEPARSAPSEPHAPDKPEPPR